MFVTNSSTLFDRMLDWSRQVDDLVARSTPTANAAPRGQLWLPPVDVYETESAFVIEADLPGVHRENVDIQFDRGALTITGTRAATLPAREKGQLRVFVGERASGGFSRSIRLPEHVDADKIEASYADGVLTLTVPKSKGALLRKIAIGGAAPSIGAK